MMGINSQHTTNNAIPSLRKLYYILVPVGLFAFSIYTYVAYPTSSTSTRRRPPLNTMYAPLNINDAPRPANTALRSAHEVSGYQEDLQELKDQQSALSQTFSTIEARLRSFLDSPSNPQEGKSKGVIISKNREAAVLPPKTGYTFWSSDFHISPIADLKDLLQPMGMKIIDKSLSGHCHLKITCATNLKVLNKDNGIDLGKCPNQLRRDFFEAYKNDKEMAQVDAFLCHHACGLCDVFMPFNKSLIVIASTRYEIGRHSPERWQAWNENLKKIAANPRNVVAANNLYDAEYIKYFTGLTNVPVIPNYCGYTRALYQPSRTEILVGPGRGIHSGLYDELKSAGSSHDITFSKIRDLYPHFEYSDLVQHPAIILIPYQVSIMSIFEYYRMAIPTFVPSVPLLAKWQIEYRLMNERTWDGVYHRLPSQSAIAAHPSINIPYDPNNEIDLEAIKYWIAFADFYVWPHIQTFDSWEDLIDKLEQTNLGETSQKMQAANDLMKKDLKAQWQEIFHRIFHDRFPASQVPLRQIMDFDESMQELYQVKVNGACQGDTHLTTAVQR